MGRKFSKMAITFEGSDSQSNPFRNCAVAVVGKDTPFAILDDARIATYLTAIEGDERAPQAQDDTLVTGDDNLPPPPPDSGPEPRVVVATERMES
ncbi:unnamed protein product [Rotaria sp. Silwood1]|nr:unnamed protein product [Rotaria sp. Silwood1]